MNVTTALPFLRGDFALPSSASSKLLLLSGTLTSSTIFFTVLVAFFIHRLTIIIYRLYFHPLSSFPGPRLAAATSLYELYHGAISPSSVSWPEYERSVLHPKYGPIVRIRPDALHISDPEAYRKIHKVGAKYTKAKYFYKPFLSESTLFGSVDLDFHRKRRNLIAPIFAKNEIVARYEDVVKEKVDLMLTRISDILSEKGGKGLVLMKNAVSAFVFDVSAEVIFKGGYNVLKSKDMTHPVTTSVDLVAESAILNRYFPSVVPYLFAVPDWLMGLVYPSALGQKVVRASVKHEVDKLAQEKRTGTFDYTKQNAVTAQLLSHFDPQTVADEGYVMLGAAIHTTQWSIQRHLYHLAANPSVQEKVFAELRAAYPDRDSGMSYTKLETLPYFVAFMKEANRLAHAIPGSNSREAPLDEPTELCGKHIPPGTVLETDIYHIHLHESVFPDPLTFDPERWLQGEKSKNLEKYLVPFNMGNMMCVGYTLANLNMHLATAGLARRFEIELTPELEKEGFRFEVPWVAVKRGAKIEFICRERTE